MGSQAMGSRIDRVELSMEDLKEIVARTELLPSSCTVQREC